MTSVEPDEPGQDAGLPPLSTQPRTVALVLAAFGLIIGVPAGLYIWAGQPEVGFALVALFVGLVLLTGYALREAARSQRRDK